MKKIFALGLTALMMIAPANAKLIYQNVDTSMTYKDVKRLYPDYGGTEMTVMVAPKKWIYVSVYFNSPGNTASQVKVTMVNEMTEAAEIGLIAKYGKPISDVELPSVLKDHAYRERNIFIRQRQVAWMVDGIVIVMTVDLDGTDLTSIVYKPVEYKQPQIIPGMPL
jgi:hypothetical protein